MPLTSRLGQLKTQEYYEYIRRVRREIHAYPELANLEKRTSALIMRELDSFNIPYTRVGTGVIARIDKGKDNTVAFRADMDALPIEECNDCGYRSARSGIMHACGHDGHVALLLAFARYQSFYPDAGNVNCVFIFQPAEEGEGGAVAMIEAGALAGVDEVYAFHVEPELESGRVAVRAGASMAGSCELDLCFYGKSSHCAQKQLGADALRACIETISGIYAGLPAHLEGRTLFHAGRIEGGYARNVVADSCKALCTVRYFDARHLSEILSLIDLNINFACSSTGVRGQKSILAKYIPVVNNPACVKKIQALTGGSAADAGVRYTAEDFAFYLEKVKGCIIWLGVNTGEQPPKKLHAPDFDFDERALLYGLELYISLVELGE